MRLSFGLNPEMLESITVHVDQRLTLISETSTDDHIAIQEIMYVLIQAYERVSALRDFLMESPGDVHRIAREGIESLMNEFDVLKDRAIIAYTRCASPFAESVSLRRNQSIVFGTDEFLYVVLVALIVLCMIYPR